MTYYRIQYILVLYYCRFNTVKYDACFSADKVRLSDCGIRLYASVVVNKFSSQHYFQKQVLIILNMSKDGMVRLPAKRQALLNDMLQREHIRMFIGLKLDMETIPNAECMKTTMTATAKAHSPDSFFSLSFTQLHVLFGWQQVFVVLASMEIEKCMC